MRGEALIVVGLGYGDEGKGSVVDHLARACDARAVVRFNGGAQAAHNVVLADGRHHTFAQFGSGTFAGAATHLSRHVLVNPALLFLEAERLTQAGVSDPLARLTIHADAPLTTPFHVAANRLRELARGDARHGSCGLGIGETMRDVVAGVHIRAGDLRQPARLRDALIDLQERKRLELRELIRSHPGHEAAPLRSAQALRDALEVFVALAETVEIVDEQPDWDGTVIYEGAQGVLLDEHAGFFPHVTWSRSTPHNARELAGPGATTIGVTRTYMTRHGAGPFVTEDATLDLPERHNGHGPWQGAWRVGHLDLVALRYAARACAGLDSLAITHADVVAPGWRAATAYEIDGETLTELPRPRDRAAQERLTRTVQRAAPIYEPAEDPVAAIETALGVPAALIASGPTAADIRSAPWRPSASTTSSSMVATTC